MISLPPENPSPHLESKYSLVIAVAKRARQIVARREPGITEIHKPVTIAMEELGQGKVKILDRRELKAGEEEPVMSAESGEALPEGDRPASAAEDAAEERPQAPAGAVAPKT